LLGDASPPLLVTADEFGRKQGVVDGHERVPVVLWFERDRHHAVLIRRRPGGAFPGEGQPVRAVQVDVPARDVEHEPAVVDVDAEASAVTVSGAEPELGVTLRAATGAASATVTVAVLLEDNPPESMTVTLTVKVPAPWYVWGAVLAV